MSVLAASKFSVLHHAYLRGLLSLSQTQPSLLTQMLLSELTESPELTTISETSERKEPVEVDSEGEEIPELEHVTSVTKPREQKKEKEKEEVLEEEGIVLTKAPGLLESFKMLNNLNDDSEEAACVTQDLIHSVKTELEKFIQTCTVKTTETDVSDQEILSLNTWLQSWS